MRCYNLKAASAISDCLLRDGPIRCALAIRTNVSTPSGIISVSTGRRIRDCASIISCSTPNWRHDSAVPASIAGSATGPAQATTRADLDRAGYGREEKRSETAAQHGQVVQHSVKGSNRPAYIEDLLLI